MSVLEIVIFNVGLLFSVLAHCFAWAIHIQITRVLERLKDCEDNIKSASKLVENSAITSSVMQLSAEQLRFDPDVNEFERDVAVLMLKDPQLSYTGETMNRPNKPQKTPLLEPKSGKQSGKKKGVRSKGEENEEPEKALPKPGSNAKTQVGAKQMNVQETQDVAEEKENPNKKKFKPPPNITKVDAKDPQYETLRGIGNELFAADKSKVDGNEEKGNKNKKFKEPLKIQKADAKDPQYETLADVKDDIFKG